MITYGYSLQGKSHVERNVVCQDANKISKLQNGAYIGVVADGVGSAKYSDSGSKIAVDKIVEYCAREIKRDSDYNTIRGILYNAYEYAFESIRRFAADYNNDVADYDTTLSAVVYDGKKVVYGHAGDGGIIVRHTDGTFAAITERQKGADGVSVRPLRAGNNSWEFGMYGRDVMAVLLTTDGMLDEVFMPYLVNLPESVEMMYSSQYKKNNVCVGSAYFFMDPNCVFKNKFISKPDEYMFRFLQGNYVQQDSEMFIKNMNYAYSLIATPNETQALTQAMEKYRFPMWATKNVTDDKSVVCLMNDVFRLNNVDYMYYMEPDWKELQNHSDRLLYNRGNNSNVPNNSNRQNVQQNNANNPNRQNVQQNNSNIPNRQNARPNNAAKSDDDLLNRINSYENKIAVINNELTKEKKKNVISSVVNIILSLLIVVVAGLIIILNGKIKELDNNIQNNSQVIEKEDESDTSEGLDEDAITAIVEETVDNRLKDAGEENSLDDDEIKKIVDELLKADNKEEFKQIFKELLEDEEIKEIIRDIKKSKKTDEGNDNTDNEVTDNEQTNNGVTEIEGPQYTIKPYEPMQN